MDKLTELVVCELRALAEPTLRSRSNRDAVEGAIYFYRVRVHDVFEEAPRRGYLGALQVPFEEKSEPNYVIVLSDTVKSILLFVYVVKCPFGTLRWCAPSEEEGSWSHCILLWYLKHLPEVGRHLRIRRLGGMKGRNATN